MSEEKNEDLAEEGKFKEIFLKKQLWVWICLVVLIILAWYIRTPNVPGLKDITTNEYTLGPDLDPFLFLRYMKYIVEHGSLMKIDSMRYVPLSYDTSGETVILPYMMAYFHKVLTIFKPVSVEYSAVMFPVFMFLLTVIVFFLFVRKIFEEKKTGNIIALIATLILIISPSLIARTVAGIPEKESAGFFFMFLSFYLFLSAWKSQKSRISDGSQDSERILKSEKKVKGIILALLAGISTAIMGLIWGGVVYVFTVIAVSVLAAFILGKVKEKEAMVYAIWTVASILALSIISVRFTLAGLLVSHSTGLDVGVLGILIIDFLIFKTKLKNSSLVEKARKKIPDRVISLIITFIVVIIISSLFFGINFIPNFFKEIARDLVNPYTDRHSLTVAENKQPYFGEWKSSFGPEIKGIPLLFWLFFIGSIFLFWKTTKKVNKRAGIILTIFYSIFILSLVFSRYSPDNLMNGVNTISKGVYFLGALVFVLSAGYFYYKYHKENKIEEFEKIDFTYLFIIFYFIVGLLGARSAIRLIMALVPSAVIIVSFFVVELVDDARKKEENKKFIFFALAAIVVLAVFYAAYFNYQFSLGAAGSMVPSVYTQQWQKAMAWVRDNTPENAVFAHWWDYGYWLQTIGRRATVLDGGNAIGYWNYLMGRHALTGASELEALEFLYSHNATHFLIDSTEIGKYGAYASIGSDENYDRYSWIGTFLINEQATQETKQGISYIYQGGIGLDEDYLYNNGEQIFFPAKAAGVGALILNLEGNNLKQPEAIFVYQGKQVKVPLRYLYYQNKLYDLNTGYKGALYIFTKIEQQGQGLNINDKGAALFLSERNMRALWIRLYLLKQGENFKLVHTEPDLLTQSLKNQGGNVNIDDIIYFNGIRGPIKIWEINYPAGIQLKEEYLSTIYPESLMKV